MADTRKDKRAPVSLKVRFKSATVDEFIEQYCRDVSRGGIFIKSSQPMPIGTLLKFQLQLKDESSLIKGVGRVVWTRSEDDASSEAPAGMGIKFIKMDGESRVVVDRIVGAHEGEPGVYDQGEPMVGSSDPPPSNGSAGSFFPNLPPAVLPPPEDRTAVRHAAQFLASALSEAGTDVAASREAELKAEEAQRRTAQIQAQRLAEAEQQKKAKSGEALPSMIIDPSLSIPPPAPSAVAAEASSARSADDDRPTDANARRAPVSERPTAHKPKPKVRSVPPSELAPEDTGVTERKQIDLSALPAADQSGAKKSNALPYFVIAAVVAAAAFLALRSDDTPVTEQPVDMAPIEQVAPAPEPAPPEPAVVEPAPVVAPEPPPAPVVLVPVKVASTPDGAEIFVGTESRGKTPLTLELPQGAPVTIRARSVGRAEASQELTPEPGQKTVKLSLAALPYVLHVDSTPPGAVVLVGARRGTTPVDLELPGAPKGPLKLTVRLPGYEVSTTTVAASSFEERDAALRSSVSLTLVENKPAAAAAPDAAPRPAPRPRPSVVPAPEPRPAEAVPVVPTPKPVEPAPGPTPGEIMPEPRPTPVPEIKPVEPAPAPKPEAAPAPKPIETAPKPELKPAAKPKPKPDPAGKPKPAPGAEPIPDNPFG